MEKSNIYHLRVRRDASGKVADTQQDVPDEDKHEHGQILVVQGQRCEKPVAETQRHKGDQPPAVGSEYVHTYNIHNEVA